MENENFYGDVTQPTQRLLDLLGFSNLEIQQATSDTFPMTQPHKQLNQGLPLTQPLNQPAGQDQPLNQGFDYIAQSVNHSFLLQANNMNQQLNIQSTYPLLIQPPLFNQGFQSTIFFQSYHQQFNQSYHQPMMNFQGFHPSMTTNPFARNDNVEYIITMLGRLNSAIESSKHDIINDSLKERLCFQLETFKDRAIDLLQKLNSQPSIDVDALTKNWKLRKATGTLPDTPTRKQYDEMMKSHSNTLSTLQGQEKAQAISKIWKEYCENIAKSTTLSHESGIRNYLGFCKSESLDPFTKRVDGLYVNVDTYNSWLAWLIEPHGKTVVERYNTAAKAWCARHNIKWPVDSKSYDSIMPGEASSNLVETEESLEMGDGKRKRKEQDEGVSSPKKKK